MNGQESPEEIVSAVRRAGEAEAAEFRSTTEASLAGVRAKIRQERGIWSSPRTVPVWIPRLAAASLLALLGWGTLRSRVSAKAEPVTQYTTARGEHKTIALPDGSEMVMGPASHVSFSVTSNRKVELTGQAYFRVKHDDAVRFVVVARNAVATDVGTEFAVRAYAEDSSVTVAVAEGVVDLSSSGNTRRLAKDVVGSVNSRNEVSAMTGDVSSFTGWASNKLVFRNASIGTIAADLSRWFNVDIKVGDKLEGARLSAVYDKPTLDDVLSAIALTTGAHVVRDGSTIHLEAEGGR